MLQIESKILDDKISNLRAIRRLIDSIQFADAFDRADEFERLTIRNLITIEDKKGIRKWIRDQLKDILEELTMTELRKQGQVLGIKNYSLCSRATLLSTIKLLQGHNNAG